MFVDEKGKVLKKPKMAMKKTKLVKDEKGKKKFSKGEYMIRG